MAGFDAARAAIEAEFIAAWPVGNPISPVPPVEFDNMKFTPPTSAPWARFTIKDGNAIYRSIQTTTSKKLTRYSGVVFVQIFLPLGSYRAQATKLADFIDGIFSGTTDLVNAFNQVNFRECTTTNVGSDGTWYQVNVQVPFDRNFYA